jgi:hypothetical protein
VWVTGRSESGVLFIRRGGFGRRVERIAVLLLVICSLAGVRVWPKVVAAEVVGEGMVAEEGMGAVLLALRRGPRGRDRSVGLSMRKFRRRCSSRRFWEGMW